MNCFMGYNPLATKQVKVTVWVCEQDGATPVAPSNPSEGDCFIVYATDEAVLSNTPTSAKSYSNGEWADAEGGGGGATFPEFTVSERVWSCDMTYAEAKAVWADNADKNLDAPCLLQEAWTTYVFLDGEAFQEAKLDFSDVPDDMTEGIFITFQSPVLYGSDGNFYLGGVD